MSGYEITSGEGLRSRVKSKAREAGMKSDNYKLVAVMKQIDTEEKSIRRSIASTLAEKPKTKGSNPIPMSPGFVKRILSVVEGW